MGTSFREGDGLSLTESSRLGTESVTESVAECRRSKESCSDGCEGEVKLGKKSISSSSNFLGWPITKAAIPKPTTSAVSGLSKPVLIHDLELKKHNLNISGKF